MKKTEFFIAAGAGAILLSLYFPTLSFPFRGEHWSLAHLFVMPMEASSRILRVMSFNCADVVRLQPLAFSVPWINFLIFKDHFIWHQLVCLGIHLISIFLLVKLLKELGAALAAQILGAVLFGISYAWADLLNWSFFSYIFLHVLVLLGSFLFLLRALQTGQNRYLTWHCALIMLAAFIYESSFSLFLLDFLAAGVLWLACRKTKEPSKLFSIAQALLIRVPLFAVLTAIPFVIFYLTLGTTDPHANHVFHWGIVEKTFSFLRWTLINGLGFDRPILLQGLVYASVTPLVLDTTWNTLAAAGTLALGAGFAFCAWKFWGSQKTQDPSRLMTAYLGLALLAYTASIAFGRVWPEGDPAGLLPSLGKNVTFFEAQMRYHYMPAALLALFLCLHFQKEMVKRFKILGWALILASGVALWGNAANIRKLNAILSKPNTMMKNHHVEISRRCAETGHAGAQCRVTQYFTDHYNWRIPDTAPFTSFVYTSNRCDTPDRSYKTPAPPLNRLKEFRMGNMAWTAAGDAPFTESKGSLILLRTQGRARGILARREPPPEIKNPGGFEVTARLRLLEGPSFDHNGFSLFFYLNQNPEEMVQAALFEDYVQFIYKGWGKAWKLPVKGNVSSLRLRVTSVWAELQFNGNELIRFQFPQTQPLAPWVEMGDASLENGQNVHVEIEKLNYRFF